MHKPLPDCKIDFDFFTKAEYPEATSCTKHQLHELKDIHDEYGGFPESYNFQNTQIRQKWWTEDEVDFKHIGDQIGMDVVHCHPYCNHLVVPYHGIVTLFF